jgi:putative hydrolase of the HAD superfamily
MIKALIFDLGKVLVPFDFTRGYTAMAERCRYPASEIPKRIGTTDLVHRFECGMMEPRDFVRRLSELLELETDYDGFCQIWSSIFSREPLVPDELLEALHRRYRLVLLSNTNPIHFEMIRANYPLLRHFDDMVLSHEVRMMKPAPEIYREAVARAGYRAGECFYTDDVAAYVEAARREGLDAVQFLSPSQLEEDMKARGIWW